MCVCESRLSASCTPWGASRLGRPSLSWSPSCRKLLSNWGPLLAASWAAVRDCCRTWGLAETPTEPLLGGGKEPKVAAPGALGGPPGGVFLTGMGGCLRWGALCVPCGEGAMLGNAQRCALGLREWLLGICAYPWLLLRLYWGCHSCAAPPTHRQHA